MNEKKRGREELIQAVKDKLDELEIFMAENHIQIVHNIRSYASYIMYDDVRIVPNYDADDVEKVISPRMDNKNMVSLPIHYYDSDYDSFEIRQ